jgi:hypothetical protein
MPAEGSLSKVRPPLDFALMLDADEAWTQIIAAFRQGLPGDGSRGSFVDDYMSIELRHT